VGAASQAEVLMPLEGVEEEFRDVFRPGAVAGNGDAWYGESANGSSGNEAKRQVFKQGIVDLRDCATLRRASCKADPAAADECRADDVRIFDCGHLLS